MSITINNSQNNVSITENNGNLEIIDNNTATSVNIPIEISTIATIASQGPKGDKGDTGAAGSLLNIPVGNIVQPFVHISASGNISASGTGSFAYGHFAHDVGIGVAPTGLAALQVRDITPNTHTSVLIDSTGGANKDVTLSLSSSAQTWRIKQYAQGAVGTGQYELQIADVNNANAKVVRIATGQSSNTLVLSGSNVGIGQLNPGEKLEVVGNISASGNLILDKITGQITASKMIIGSSDEFVVTETHIKTNTANITHNDGNDGVFWKFKGENDDNLLYLNAPEDNVKIGGVPGLGDKKLTVIGDISSSGNVYASNVVLTPDGTISPSVNHQTIKFMTKPPGAADNGERFTIGEDLIAFYGSTGTNTPYALLQMDMTDGQEAIQFNAASHDVDFKLFSDNTTAMVMNAGHDAFALRDHVGIGYDSNKWPTSDYSLSGTFDKQLMVSGITHLTGSVEIVGPITTHVTASGNISSSMTLTANQLIVNYDSIATSDPGVKGQVYRNGSNQLFISAG